MVGEGVECEWEAVRAWREGGRPEGGLCVEGHVLACVCGRGFTLIDHRRREKGEQRGV